MMLLLHSEATQFAVLVRTELAADLPQVMGDRVQLQQVLMNLMMNSIDAMKDVDGTRELTIQSQRGENGQVLIWVSDTGAGFHRSRRTRSLMHSLPPKLMEPASDCESAAPLLNRTGAACRLSTTLRAAQDFISHYPTATRPTRSNSRI
jgi:phosphoglycerate-specific signal transduction histidine kinase